VRSVDNKYVAVSKLRGSDYLDTEVGLGVEHVEGGREIFGGRREPLSQVLFLALLKPHTRVDIWSNLGCF
jgi:hypothetical protein